VALSRDAWVGIAVSVFLTVAAAGSAPWWWRYVHPTEPAQRPSVQQGAQRSATAEAPRPTSRGTWIPIPTRAWHGFGVASASSQPGGVTRVSFEEGLTLANKWAGVAAQVPKSCHYTLQMQARVLSTNSAQSGYGVASGRLLRKDIPQGPAFQYDFGFGGYRVLTYPNDFIDPAGSYMGATLNHQWHTILLVVWKGISAYVDGSRVLSLASSEGCGIPIIRVWSATIEFRHVMIQNN
jgi:hypothetical protein